MMYITADKYKSAVLILLDAEQVFNAIQIIFRKFVQRKYRFPLYFSLDYNLVSLLKSN